MHDAQVLTPADDAAVNANMYRVKRVWMDAWQLECCGTPFSVGSTIAWRLKPVDRLFLEPVLGRTEGERLTDAEEHHGDADADEEPTLGVVRSIEAVFCDYERPAEGRGMTPVPGSAVLRQRKATVLTDEFEPGRKFLGYIVGLAPAEGAR